MNLKRWSFSGYTGVWRFWYSNISQQSCHVFVSRLQLKEGIGTLSFPNVKHPSVFVTANHLPPSTLPSASPSLAPINFMSSVRTSINLLFDLPPGREAAHLNLVLSPAMPPVYSSVPLSIQHTDAPVSMWIYWSSLWLLFFCPFSHRLKEPSSEAPEWTSPQADSRLPSLASTSSLQTSTLVNHCDTLCCVLYHSADLKGPKVDNI